MTEKPSTVFERLQQELEEFALVLQRERGVGTRLSEGVWEV